MTSGGFLLGAAIGAALFSLCALYIRRRFSRLLS